MSRPAPAAVAAALATVAAGAGVAHGNGRPPATISAHTRAGNTTELYVGSTFGLLISRDDGCSFQWICEQNIGYGGTFDPKYEIARDGTIYATTFDGLRISRDGGCSFTTAAKDGAHLAGVWVDAIDLGPDDDVWIATAESGGYNDVYHSTDAGRTFTAMGRRSATIWWKSVLVAPANAMRVYVSGYQVATINRDLTLPPPRTRPPGPAAFVFRTDDGGATWNDLLLTGIQTATTPVVLLEGVDPENPDVVFARSLGANPPNGDRLYRTTNGGASWDEVMVTTEPIRDVVFTHDRRILVALTNAGIFASTDGGAAFVQLPGQPQTACLAERDDGILFACGTNWEPDFKAVARSNDGAVVWQDIIRFSRLGGPVQCPEHTEQYKTCELIVWPVLREQFGANAPVCAVDEPDAPGPPPGGSGCCDASGGGPVSALAALALCAIVGPRRRAARR